MAAIRLSEKYGVNPAVPRCYYCLEDKNEILLPGRLPGDVEAPQGAVWNKVPCDTCRGLMEQGILLISVDEAKSLDKGNPWRTGGWVVVREEVVRRLVQPPELVEAICKQRVAFVPDDAWDKLGLPRGPQETHP